MLTSSRLGIDRDIAVDLNRQMFELMHLADNKGVRRNEQLTGVGALREVVLGRQFFLRETAKDALKLLDLAKFGQIAHRTSSRVLNVGAFGIWLAPDKLFCCDTAVCVFTAVAMAFDCTIEA